MRIYKFFFIMLIALLLEVVLLDLMMHPLLSLVKLCALAALVQGDLPWYAQAYLLLMVSVSSFLQGFPMVYDVVGFGLLIVASSLLRDVMVRNLAVQSVMVALASLLFLGLDCFSCLTVGNFFATILIAPFVIKFLR